DWSSDVCSSDLIFFLLIVLALQNPLCSLPIRTPSKYHRATLKRAQTAFYEPDARFAMPVHPPSIHSQLLSHFLTPFKQKRTPNKPFSLLSVRRFFRRDKLIFSYQFVQK